MANDKIPGLTAICIGTGVTLGIIVCLFFGQKIAFGIINGAYLGLLVGTMWDIILVVQKENQQHS